MDRIDELKSLIENCKKMIESSEKEIEIIQSKKSTFERVEKGLHYYGIEVDWLGATAKSYVDNRSVFGSAMFKNNNYFLTKERAEEVADKINFLLKLERLHDTFCPDYKPDWEDGRFKWCKKPFEPNSKHKKYCCVECAKNGTEKSRWEYRIKNKEKIIERARKQYIHKISYCKVCGVKLPHGRQAYCLDCLIKSYKSDDMEKHRHTRSILYCRGYDGEMIKEECEKRGII